MPVSSKSRSRFQSLSRRLGSLAAVLGLGVLAGAGATMPDGRPTPTGLEVPRWVSLKSSEVRARQGPGLDYRILWEYRVAGLPVQVIAETREWRKICDPEGSVAWIHRSVVSGRRGAFNASTAEIPVRARQADEAPLKARFSARSVLALDDCKAGWCEVRARKLRGWVAQGSVFGTETRALCDARRPAGEAEPIRPSR
jgi:SH3-like domain-containing protein